MNLDINAADLTVSVNGDDNILFRGHTVLVDRTDDGQLTIQCDTCNKKEVLFPVPPERKWTAVYYLLGRFDKNCDKPGEAVEQRLEKVLNQYIGTLANQSTLMEIEEDVERVVGSDASVNANFK